MYIFSCVISFLCRFIFRIYSCRFFFSWWLSALSVLGRLTLHVRVGQKKETHCSLNFFFISWIDQHSLLLLLDLKLCFLYVQFVKKFTHVFSSITCMISVLKIKSLIQMEFILAYEASYGSNFNLFANGYPVVPMPFIKTFICPSGTWDATEIMCSISLCTLICLWTFYPVLLVCLFMCQYQSGLINSRGFIAFPFQCFHIYSCLFFHMNFRIHFSYCFTVFSFFNFSLWYLGKFIIFVLNIAVILYH